MKIIANIYWILPMYQALYKYYLMFSLQHEQLPRNNYTDSHFLIRGKLKSSEATWLGSGKLAFEPGILAPGLYFWLLHDASSSLESPEVQIVVSEVSGMVEVPGAVGAVSTMGGSPEVCPEATFLNLKHPSAAVLTCCVASGKALTSLNLSPIYRVGSYNLYFVVLWGQLNINCV